MASTDARPVPRKNVAYRVYLPIFDADGDLVTGASSLDSEVSKDGGSFTDCTNEATEIGSSGIYYLELTSTEMNADSVVIIVKTATSGAKTTPIFLYPEEAGDFRADVTHFGGSAGTFASGRPEVNTTHAAGTAWGSGAITAASIASNAITAAKIATDAIDADAIATDAVTEIQSGLSTLTAAGVRTAVGLASANLDTQLSAIDDFLDTEIAAIKAKTDNLPTDPADASDIAALLGAIDDFVDTEVAAIKTVTDKLDDTLEDQGGGVYGFTVAALQEAPTGGSAPSAADIADAVWDEDLSGHTTAGSSGKIVSDILVDTGTTLDGKLNTIDDFLDTEIAAILAAVDTEVASILADTNELQTDLVDGGRLDLLIDAIKAKTDNLPSDPADASVVAGLIAAVETKVDTVDTVVDAIKLKTDNLPSDPADASVVATLISAVEAKVDIIDTNVDDIETLLGATDADVSDIKAKTDSLTFTTAGQVDANIQSINDVVLDGTGVNGDSWRPA